jgi:hypothetical protein
MYWLLPVSDWLDSLIAPSGLLLVVVSHQLAVPVSVLWVELEKKLVTKTWMWEYVFGGSHTERCWWRYSKRPKEGCVPNKGQLTQACLCPPYLGNNPDMWNLPCKMPFSSYGSESAICITEKLLPDPYIVTRREH